MRLAAALCLATAWAVAPGYATSWAQSSDTRAAVPSITVGGRATRDVVPDQAVITVGVATDRPTASDAAAQNTRTAAALLDEIKATGIPDPDVETIQASLTPVYDTDRSGAIGTKIKGFHAANEVRIRVRNLGQVGPLVGRLLDKGANSLEGVDYAVGNATPVMDELRAEATRDARRKAQIYADAAGVKLGRILLISPEGTTTPMPVAARMMKTQSIMAQPAAPMPVQAGSETLAAEVGVTWELVQ